MIDWFFAILIIGYCLFILYLWLGWERIPLVSNKDQNLSVAVIIPVRNEASNIEYLLRDFQNQSYKGCFELLIIDDHSEDNTVELVKDFSKSFLNCKLISLVEEYGKKAAITTGVNSTNASIILTTDGDCRVSINWIDSMLSSFSKQTQLVSGPVKFSSRDASFFSKLQAIEFASLIGSGAALIGWSKPVMANGANMGFRRETFLEIKGFEGNLQLASGDDVFLLHKIAKAYPKSVAFVKQVGAIITTKSQPTIASFVQQRIRWASKWQAYSDAFTKITAVLVFLLSLSLVLMPFFIAYQSASLFLWLNLLVIKSFFDFFFIKQISKFMEEKVDLIPFVLLQLIHPFYVVSTALLSFQKTYYWKGRKVK